MSRPVLDRDLTSGGGIPLLGEELLNWRITGIIGAGAMGTVYSAMHGITHGEVAVKVLSSKYLDDPGRVNRFFAEAKLIGRINHGNVVVVHDVGTLSDGRPYYVMELVDGFPLASVASGSTRPSIEWVVDTMVGVLSGLGAAHAQGILHRDVKPANILITREGVAKLSDFGVAKLIPELADMQISLTTDGTLLGTPAYLSPEQAMGVADARSDLYSVGVTLYEVLCGRLPFRGPTLFETLRMHQEMPPPPPSLLRPDLPPALEAVILRALAKNPADRHQSAAEMAEALRAAMSAPAMMTPMPPLHAAELGRTVLQEAPPPLASMVSMAPPAPSTGTLTTPVLALGAVVVVFGVILGFLVMSRSARSDDRPAPAAVAPQTPAPAPVTAPPPAAAAAPAPTPAPVATPDTAQALPPVAEPEPEAEAEAEVEAIAPPTPRTRARVPRKKRARTHEVSAPRAQAPRPSPPPPEPQPKPEPAPRVRYLDGNDL
jgi:serine/threonine-protein kinase